MSNDDCYFYYYSSCVKGNACPFRHEPAALAQEVVCSYWQKGTCTKPHCIFRHLDVTSKKRNVMPCYFESQPGGCKKPHCAFLHETPKEPLPEEVQQILEKPQGGTIIVNKNKIGELGNLILPVQAAQKPAAPPAAAPRVSVRDRLGPASGGDLRTRLGGTVAAAAKPSLRDRLGGVVQDERIELIEYSGDESEMDSEEEALRASAIRTLDLRKRIDNTRPVEEEEESETEVRKVKSVVVKKAKKAKKEKKEKKKKEKKEKKVKRLKKKTSSLAGKALRELKSNAQDSSEGETKRIVMRSASSDEANVEDDDEGISLADRVAKRRSEEFGGKKRSSRSAKRKSEEAKESKASKRTISKSEDSEGQAKSKRKRKKSESSSRSEEDDEKKSSAPKVTKKSSKVKSSDPDEEEKKRKLEETKKEMEEVEKFLKDPSVDAAANSSMDVMKELDELLNDG